MSNVLHQFPHVVPSAAVTSAEPQAQQYRRMIGTQPAITSEDVDTILPQTGTFTASWTYADEQAILDQWNNQVAARFEAHLSSSTTGHTYCHLYKVCLRLQCCGPTAIAGPRRNLKYRPLAGSSTAVLNMEEQCWSVGFCKSLADLLVHPLFWHGDRGQGPDFLAMLLQFVAICRSGYRSEWQIPASVACPVLRQLHSRLSVADSQTEDGPTIRDVFLDLHHQSDEMVTVERQLMFQIAQDIERPSRTEAVHRLEPRPANLYEVTRTDLNIVSRAIDQLPAHYGYRSVREMEEEFKVVRSQRELPRKRDILDLIKRDWLQEARDEMSRWSMQPTSSATSGHPDPSGNQASASGDSNSALGNDGVVQNTPDPFGHGYNEGNGDHPHPGIEEYREDRHDENIEMTVIEEEDPHSEHPSGSGMDRLNNAGDIAASRSSGKSRRGERHQTVSDSEQDVEHKSKRHRSQRILSNSEEEDEENLLGLFL